LHSTNAASAKVVIRVHGENVEFSPILLRDLCQCPRCVHESTRQKLYSTADIPSHIEARSVASSSSQDGSVDIKWANDVPGYGAGHITSISESMLTQIKASGATPSPFQGYVPKPVLWDASSADLPDYGYDSYMKDDATVYEVIKQLRTHGLVFVTHVPGMEQSVAAVGERIGPVRDTFYGRTWDGKLLRL
jgi:gamma-butyrobetaine dioxygenase